MKYGITKMYEASNPNSGGGSAPAPVTKAEVLKSLGTIKEALEKNLNEKAENQQKNLDDKLAEVNKAIAELKEAKPEVTAEQLAKVESDLAVTIKALDIVQGRVKSQKMTSTSFNGEDISMKAQIQKGFESFRDNIKNNKIAKGDNEITIQVKAVGDMTLAANVSTGVVPNTYRGGIVPQPFEMVHMRDLVAVTPSGTDSYHFYRHNLGEGSIEFQG